MFMKLSKIVESKVFMDVCRKQNQIASLNKGYEDSWTPRLFVSPLDQTSQCPGTLEETLVHKVPLSRQFCPQRHWRGI